MQIQKEGKNIQEAVIGDEVAISIDKAVYGRHIKDGTVLYVDIPESHARLINRELLQYLTEDAKEVFREFLKIKRKIHGFTWGM